MEHGRGLGTGELGMCYTLYITRYLSVEFEDDEAVLKSKAAIILGFVFCGI